MLQVYLPVAEISVNLLVMLGLGAAIGFLSGMFGVGGGFLLTPLLMFSGIPPAIAVATGANQIVASSVSGALVQWRRGNIDFRMGWVLIIGGVVGAVAGVLLVGLLSRLGHADVFISLVYVTFLGVIGSLMLVESVSAIRRTRAGLPGRARKPGEHTWIHGLPFKMRFPRSRLYISAIPPLILGAIVGLLASILGVGGGFIVVPGMIYLLRMPTNVVIGTSLFQIIFVTASDRFAVSSYTVDALHYMLKPVTRRELTGAMSKALSRLHERDRQVLRVKSTGGLYSVRHSRIIYIESAGHKISLILDGLPPICVYGRLDEYEQNVRQDSRFIRIHKSYLVNADYISYFGSDAVELTDKRTLAISRSFNKSARNCYLAYVLGEYSSV
jgi:uncharacterized membrane protein YfcA